MKQAFFGYDFIDFNGVFIGVSLGYDYTSEHEWGIGKMTNALGIPETTRDNVGIKCRTITLAPETNVQYREVKDLTYFTFVAYSYRDKPFNEDDLYTVQGFSCSFKDNMINTAWDGSGFSIVGKGNASRVKIKELYENYLKKNLAITYLGHGNPFANNSLAILIVDRLPQEYLEMMVKTDTEGLDLKDRITHMDLENKARKNGMDYNHFYAISPKFIKYGATFDELEAEKKTLEMETKYDVMVWVNGSGSGEKNYGWFTVEEVLDWISHKGAKQIGEYNKEK